MMFWVLGVVMLLGVGLLLAARIPADAMVAIPLPENRDTLRFLGGMLVGVGLVFLLLGGILNREAPAILPTATVPPTDLPAIQIINTATPMPPTFTPTTPPATPAPLQSVRR